MRKTFVIGVLIFTTVSIALAQTQSARRNQNTSVEQVIRQLDHERIQAQIGANAVALNRIYADDFIGIGPSGTVRTKPQVILDFTSGELKFQSITTDDVRVRVYGNTAVETGRSTMIGQDKGKAVPRDNRFTRVWIKDGGRWRLVANHYSPLIRSETEMAYRESCDARRTTRWTGAAGACFASSLLAVRISATQVSATTLEANVSTI
jgi:ketosteroid isomerase-like protein